MNKKFLYILFGFLSIPLIGLLVYIDAFGSFVLWSRQYAGGQIEKLFILILVSLLFAGLVLVMKSRENKSLRQHLASEIIDHANTKKRYRNLIDEAPIMYVMVIDKLGTPVIEDVNKKFLDALEYSPEEVIGKSIAKFYTPTSVKALFDGGGYESALEGRFGERERCLVRKDGKVLYTLAYSIPVKDQSGRITGLRSMYIDITDRHRIETSVRRLATAIEHLDEIVLITDDEAKVVYVNPAFEKISGYSQDEIIGQNPRILQSGHQNQTFYTQMWDTLLKGSVWRGRFKNKRKNGTIFIEDASISPVMDDQGNISNYVAVKRDVSKEIELETRLNQAMKMEAIGTLAGGIAHDFNNILSSVIGFTELALDDAEAKSLQEQNLQEVLTAGNRAKDLVKQILTFARQADEEIKPLQVEFIIKEAMKLLRSTAPSTIEFQTNIQSNSLVMADPTQIHQVIMNLLTNAVHSMNRKGGLLKVELLDEAIGSNNPKAPQYIKPGSYVKLSVSDTGHGISPEHLDSIFEPYFTTKPPGAGTGLGLSTVYGIVKKYDGEVRVESCLNKGSTFHVLFPIVKKQKGEDYASAGILPTGKEKILFVDDELAIANVSGRILSTLGYNVTIRTSSIEALALFKNKPHEFDLIITDLTMPNMTGDQLAIKMMEVKPDIPVILCSGFSRPETEQRSLAMGIKAFVYKPLVKGELAKIVREVIDNAIMQRDASVYRGS